MAFSVDLNIQTVEKCSRSSPKDTASKTHVPSLVTSQPQQSSSLLLIGDLILSNVDNMVNSIVQEIILEGMSIDPLHDQTTIEPISSPEPSQA